MHTKVNIGIEFVRMESRSCPMKGTKCKCGFATVSGRKACPKCGRVMEEAEWPDEGRVLSFTRLQAEPEGLKEPHNLVLVGIAKGPKLVCWTTATLDEDDEVAIADMGGKYFCNPMDLSFKLDAKDSKLD